MDWDYCWAAERKDCRAAPQQAEFETAHI